MNVIAKMQVSSIEDYGYSRQIKMTCQYDGAINTGDNAENRSFTKATPNGALSMTVDNKAVWDSFKLPSFQTEEEPARKASMKYVVFIDADKYNLADVYRALDALDHADAEVS